MGRRSGSIGDADRERKDPYQPVQKKEEREEVAEKQALAAGPHVSGMLRDPRLGHPANAGRRALLLHAGQRALGSQALQRALRPLDIRTRLAVTAADDAYEQEADRVAETVMTTPDVQRQRQDVPEEEEAQTKPLAGVITPLVRRQEVPEEEAQSSLLPGRAAPVVQRQAEEEEEEAQTKLLPGRAAPAVQRQAEEEEEETQTKLLPGRAAPVVQRQAEEEEEETQTKLLPGRAAPAVQRQAEEEEEEAQTKPLPGLAAPVVQRQAEEEEEEAHTSLLPGRAAPVIQRQAEEEEEETQAKPLPGRPTPIAWRRAWQEEERPTRARPFAGRVTRTVQRQEEGPEEEEEEPVQARAEPGKAVAVPAGIERRIHSLRGAGRPLSGPERTFFEARFGNDFGQVRVHADTGAARLAQALRARAFTVGEDIAFGAGQYSPGTTDGRQLLAHELAHVLQQADGQPARAAIQLDNEKGTPPAPTPAPSPAPGRPTDFSQWPSTIPRKPAANLSPEEQAAVDQLVGQVARTRGGLAERFMRRVKQGFMYTAEMESTYGIGQGRSSAAEYREWLRTAKPDQIKNRLSDPLVKAQCELWDDISGEGDPSAMNTWDSMRVTWGRGFAGVLVRQVIGMLFKEDPDAAGMFFSAGISLEGGKFIAVDVNAKMVREGAAAEAIVQGDPKLVSLFVEVAQSQEMTKAGVTRRQLLMNIQWQVFVQTTGAIPGWALPWDRKARAVAGHNIHGGNFTWADFQGTGGDLTQIVIKIGTKLGQVRPNGAIVVPESVTQNRLQNLAKGYAMAVLGQPVRWGKTTLFTPEGEKIGEDEEGFEPGNIYFRVPGREAYYIVKL